MADKTPVSSSASCPHCRGCGPVARIDWNRCQPGDRCPDCGALSLPELSSPSAVQARPVRRPPLEVALGKLRDVISLLEPEEQDAEIARLERRAALLDPRGRPEPEPEAEPPCCPTCAAPSRRHRYASRLLVCTSPECGAIWSKSRRGRAVLETM